MNIILLLLLLLFVKNIEYSTSFPYSTTRLERAVAEGVGERWNSGDDRRRSSAPLHGSLQLLTNKECKNIQLDPATQLDIAYQYKKQNPKTKIVMYDNIVKRISSKSKLSITQIKKCIKISKNN